MIEWHALRVNNRNKFNPPSKINLTCLLFLHAGNLSRNIEPPYYSLLQSLSCLVRLPGASFRGLIQPCHTSLYANHVLWQKSFYVLIKGVGASLP